MFDIGFAGEASAFHHLPSVGEDNEEDDIWHDCQSSFSPGLDNLPGKGSGPTSPVAAADTDFAPAAAPSTSIELGRSRLTPDELHTLYEALQLELTRPVDAALAAETLSKILHRISMRQQERSRPLDMLERVRCITDDDVRDFMRAAGLAAHHIEAGAIAQGRAAALASLSTLPAALLGTCLSSVINAIYPENDLARLLGFLLNVAILAATPVINACLLQPFGALADRWRAEHFVVRLDRTRIHDQHDKPALTRRIGLAVRRYDEARQALLDALHAGAGEANGSADRLEMLRHAHTGAAEALRTLLTDVRAKQAADTRVRLENRYQQVARYLKLVLSPVGQLLRAGPWISAWASAGFQLGTSSGTSALQAWLAARDEGCKQRFTIGFLLLEAAPLTPDGADKARRGHSLQATDVDETRLRDFFTGPQKARAAMLATCLRAHAGHEEQRLAGAVADASANLPDDQVRAELVRLRVDIERVERLQLNDLALDGVAARLLQPGRATDALLWAEISARLQKRGELSSQFCKFLGQQWQVGIGPGYFVFVPKLLNVVSKGKPPMPGMVACAGLAALLGLAGCRAHAEVVVERNEFQVRVDHGEADIGLIAMARHAGIALVALPRQLRQRQQFEPAVQTLLERLGQAEEIERRPLQDIDGDWRQGTSSAEERLAPRASSSTLVLREA
ncbi:hypothetical protein [Xylophilus sp. GOD-11R]|uniref:hypothetical protein n=1 Tax=Xylophilus sp. GOD-11R TaxID=3089814 RepID=UPI00298D20EF|nr:hypothetical protein [Xylophilus sp. GOD-11R]WPB56764.1 hypothetical protein R9X41_21925 [Xylophilus sp. GOD-11R]